MTIPSDRPNQQLKVDAKTIRGLTIAFVINILFSVVEVFYGIITNSTALVGDALHNTSDAFSLLIALIAYKIGTKKANQRFSYGFNRAETMGSFVNLILLFMSGCYLFLEGLIRIFRPETVDGMTIIWVSVLAIIIDSFTARLSHHHAHHNTNMRLVFIHNLADVCGSVGVIISGLAVLWFNWHFVDGLIALFISLYMLVQAVQNFPKITQILMNAVPQQLDLNRVRRAMLAFPGVTAVLHLHIWNIYEGKISLECHIRAMPPFTLHQFQDFLLREFNIEHSTVQIEPIDEERIEPI